MLSSGRHVRFLRDVYQMAVSGCAAVRPHVSGAWPRAGHPNLSADALWLFMETPADLGGLSVVLPLVLRSARLWLKTAVCVRWMCAVCVRWVCVVSVPVCVCVCVCVSMCVCMYVMYGVCAVCVWCISGERAEYVVMCVMYGVCVLFVQCVIGVYAVREQCMYVCV